MSPTPENPVFTAEIRGVPQYVPQSLDGLANALVRTGCSSIYQVWASPRKPSLIGRQIAKRRYGSVLGRSQRQEAVESSIVGGRETRTRFDVDALSSTELHKASYERMYDEKVLECRVIIACWGSSANEAVLNSVLNTFLGTLSSPDKRKQLRTKVHRVIFWMLIPVDWFEFLAGRGYGEEIEVLALYWFACFMWVRVITLLAGVIVFVPDVTGRIDRGQT